MSELIDKLFAVHDSLTAASLAHAFGGAIALAYCTEEPRGTRDLDVNIFSDSSHAATVLAALPDDADVLAHGFTLFDGLYATLSAKDGEA